MIALEIIIIASLASAGLVTLAVRYANKNFGARLKAAQDQASPAVEHILSAERLYDEAVEARFEQFARLKAEKNPPSEVDVERLVEDFFVIVKPSINALLASINAEDHRSRHARRIEFTSRYFNSAVALADAFIAWRVNSYDNGPMLSSAHEDKMYQTFRDAMRSDIKQRMLALAPAAQALHSAPATPVLTEPPADPKTDSKNEAEQ
jgi:hypothetical protein